MTNKPPSDGIAKLLKKIHTSSFTGITDDSRKVKKGFVFVAIKGLTSDGHKYIAQARENGAKYVIGEKGDVDVKVKDSREMLSLLASSWYDLPSKKLKIIGVTGTDGKTTTATLIYSILKSAGKRVGLVSTVNARIGNQEYETGFHTTNPEPLDLQRFLALMVEKKCEYAVLEVTSHGLDQGRVYGIDFDLGVLTNITHEHLDYHKTFTNYISAKEKMFKNSKVKILNARYAKLIKTQSGRVLYDDNTLGGTLKKSVLGRFKEPYNQLNATAAAVAAENLGIEDKYIVRGIRQFKGIPGRMQEVKNMKGVRIIIDFAHTPNALENLLSVLKRETPKSKKLIVVFGCAGERDIQKRPMMGKISGDLADISVFTAEDPRNEKTEDIILQMNKGVKNKKAKIFRIVERGDAIFFAINKLAKRGDIVVICGKGHEKSMNYYDTEYPWSDKDAVEEALKGRMKKIERVAVFGLGVEGKDLVCYLTRNNVYPVVLDEGDKEKVDVSGLPEGKFLLVNNKNVARELEKFSTVYRSPGVYRFRKEFVSVEKAGVQISSAIKCFFDLCPAKIIGVTGTKGKGTTSTLIYKILKKAGKKVYLAGNIGKPYLKLLPTLTKKDFVVLELSSFQLIDADKSPEIAVVLNITVDHLDWHKSRGEYVRAKSNIVRFQDKNDTAVINSEYTTSRNFSRLTKAKIRFFSKKRLDLKFRLHRSLLGEHNLENIAAAVSVARALRISDKITQKAVKEFKGLEHRLEKVRTLDGVSYYNDSFSTNPGTTIAAIKSFDCPMTVILGGYDKGLDYNGMAREISRSANVYNIILIGDTAKKIKKALVKAKFMKEIWEMGKPSMRNIVVKARRVTPAGGVVLLSPASASFDMFKDYKERGSLFKRFVRSM